MRRTGSRGRFWREAGVMQIVEGRKQLQWMLIALHLPRGAP
jgi:hypothetical protein